MLIDVFWYEDGCVEGMAYHAGNLGKEAISLKLSLGCTPVQALQQLASRLEEWLEMERDGSDEADELELEDGELDADAARWTIADDANLGGGPFE